MSNNAAQKSGLRFTIKQKLLLNALINIALMLSIGLYALNQMKLVGAEVEEIAEIDMPLVNMIANIETHQLEQAVALERLLRLGNQSYQSALTLQAYSTSKTKFYSLGEQVNKEIAFAESETQKDIKNTPFELDREEFQYVLQQLLTIDKHHKRYQQDASHIIALLTDQIDQEYSNKKKPQIPPQHQGAPSSPSKVSTNDIETNQQALTLNQLIIDLEQEQNNLEHELEQLLQEIVAFTQASLYAAEEHEKSAIEQVLILIILGTFLAAIGSLFIIRLITLPIARLKELGNKIAIGDLSQKVTQINNDELGDLSLSINSTIESMAQAAAQAEAIASGNFSQDITPRGAQDKLGHALHDMKAQIIEKNINLAEKIALNEGIVNTSLDAILSIDEQGIILSCNTATQRLFHHSPEDIIGQNIKMLMPMPFSGEHDSYLQNYRNTGIKKNYW